jgi:hypothetical protein
MKPLYALLFIMALMFGGYFVINGFSFDNISFSDYLINTLFILLLSCVLLGATVVWFINFKRKHNYKGIMTIRQYYQYKS